MSESMSETPSPSPNNTTVRLQRALAAAGIASRRQCEKIILEGRVDVDGKTVAELGTKVDPQRQKITVDGQPIRRQRHVYYMLNKPPGVLSTSHDESGRIRAIDLIDAKERVYTVGRLDKSSEGLIVVTNDGDLANQLTHPRYGIEKTYLVRVVGRPTAENFERLRAGVYLAEGFARVANIRVKKQFENCTDLEIMLNEGRNREIRRVLASVGHKVVTLKRIAIGPVRLGDLPIGAYRELTRAEVDTLRGVVESQGKRTPSRRKARVGGARSRRPKFSVRALGPTSPRGNATGPRSPKTASPGRATHRRPSRGPGKGMTSHGKAQATRPGQPRTGRSRRGQLKSSQLRGGRRASRS